MLAPLVGDMKFAKQISPLLNILLLGRDAHYQ